MREWWRRWPDANIGLRTGEASGLVVLDIDVDSGGAESLVALEAELGGLPTTLTALTGGGGRHLFFIHPQVPIRNSASKVGSGLDVRGDGGYVVVPPSHHASGGFYRWAPSLGPDEVELAPLPERLLELLIAEARPAERSALQQLDHDGPIVKGRRNQTLMSLAGTMRRRGMAEQEILAALKVTNATRVDPPLPEAEVKQIAINASRYEPAPPAYKRTDYGNAQRLVNRHGDDLRFSPGVGWLVWDGRRWRRDSDGAAMRRMKETVRAMWQELATATDRDGFYKFLVRSESAPRLRAALELAESEPLVVADASTLDREPWLLNLTNGTLDLRTGELHEHRRQDLLTKLSPVKYVPDARSELWEQFLDRVTGNDRKLAAFLQRAVGYSLTGDTREEKLFFAHGPAASGKSTFLEAVKAVLGEYAATADFESFLKKKGDSGVRNDIARLAGTRLAVGIEVEQGKRLAEGLVKSLTGGDTVTARLLYKEYFEFLPQFKLWLAANDRPHVSAADSGMWRRIVQVPFTEAIPTAERDPNLKNRLKQDSHIQSAILAWAVEGALAWQQQGLAVPDRVLQYTEEYRQENDPLADFFDEQLVFEPNARVSRSELRQAYQRWALRNGVFSVSPQTLAGALRSRGVNDSAKLGGERAWAGVRLLEVSPKEGSNETPF